jgi:hypothetical protein
MWVRTAKLPPNLFNQATPTLMPVLVEEALQYFIENPQGTFYANMLLAAHPLLEMRQLLSG